MKEYVVLFNRACEDHGMVAFESLWKLIFWFLRNVRHCKVLTIFVYPKVDKGGKDGSN